MSAVYKTKENLVIDFQELRKEYDAIKTLYEKDITHHKQVEERLTISETNYRRLFETAKDGIILLDAETGMITDVNPFLIELLGYSKAQFVEKTIWEIGFFKDIVANHDKFLELQQKEYVRYDDLPLEAADGRKIRVEFVSNVYPVNHHYVIQCNIREITKRKQAEEALRESENRYHDFIEQVRDAVFSVSPQGLLVSLNKAFEHITGWRVQEWIGRPFIDIIHPEDIPLALNRVSTLLNGQNADAVELRIRKKSGDYVVSEILATTQMKNGMTIGLLGIGRDITDRKRAEKELILAKEKAEESDRLKSAFLANMSHEIRTPMNGILGFAQLLREPDLTGEEQQKFLGIIEKSGARMLNIITDIVSISKIESGQMEISISETNINEQMEFVYSFFKPEAEEKGIRLLVNNTMPLKESIIKTDREKLYAILTNLVKNAIKFTREGSIEFGYEKKGKYLEFFVKDTGEGIPEQKKEIIFERFRQGSESLARAYEGAGLGLSISKAYIEMLGGKIWVESELGKGSTFYFTIPYNAETEPEIITKEPVSKGDKVGAMKNLKILIAEDDESSEMFLSTALTRLVKELLIARTGVKAIEICRNNPDIDLVLMDIRMPDMDGYEATRQIREFNKDVVIIAQTAYALAGDREKAIEAGCNDHIGKPIIISVLKGLIQKHFKK